MGARSEPRARALPHHPTRARRRPGERTLLVAYLATVGILLAPLAVGSCRDRALGALQSAADTWNSRWTARLERGQALFEAGRYEDAAAYLEALDRVFPAPLVKYARDREREQLLRTLGASQLALGRKRRTLETYRRLVAFDPLAYRSRVLLADAALHFGETAEALAQLEQVLRVHPTHLPSLRIVVGAAVDAGRWDAAVAAYERYLDALQLQRVEIRWADRGAVVLVPVDGRSHTAQAPLRTGALESADAGAPEGFVLDVGGLAGELASLAWEAPLRVGALGASGASAGGHRETRIGWAASPTEPAQRLSLPAPPQDVARVRLRLRLFKPFDPALWTDVQAAYRNRLDWDGLARARDRSGPGADPERVAGRTP